MVRKGLFPVSFCDHPRSLGGPDPLEPPKSATGKGFTGVCMCYHAIYSIPRALYYIAILVSQLYLAFHVDMA